MNAGVLVVLLIVVVSVLGMALVRPGPTPPPRGH